jgi:segregation and condensation protein B
MPRRGLDRQQRNRENAIPVRKDLKSLPRGLRQTKYRCDLPTQLGSVAARYRFSLATQAGDRQGSPCWWKFPRRVHRGARGDSTDPVAVFGVDCAVRDIRVSRLEAVLFLAREPLHARKLAKFANLTDGTEANTLIQRLNQLYDLQGRPFRVENVAGGWQLRTREKFGPWVRRLRHVTPEVRLSPPSMETLIVVAYRQPVVRAEIEGIRGVNCGEVLRQLMEKDLVRVAGRSNDLGRPFFYATTRKFLQVFGLRDLSELPRIDLFRGIQNGRESTDTTGNLVEGDKDVAVTQIREQDDLKIQSWTSGLAATKIVARAKDEDEEEEWEDDDVAADDDEDDDDWDDEDDEDDDWDDEDDEEEEVAEEESDEEELEEEELEDEDDEEWEEVEDEEELDDEEEDDDDDWDDDEEDEEEWEEEDEV